MAEVEANIVLKTTGGSDSAAEIKQATNAVQNLTSASGDLQGRFQERFQHVGLMLFAGDALRASGLGRETRMVIGTLNLALQEGAAAAGISSGGILLLVTALGALAAIAVKVATHHKGMIDDLEKTTQATDKEAESIDQVLQKFADYTRVGGTLTQAQKDYADALHRVSEELQNNQIVALEKMIKALEENRQKIISHAETVATWHSLLSKIKPVWDATVAALEKALFVDKLKAAAQATEEWLNRLLGASRATKVAGEDLSHMNAALDQNDLKLRKAIADLEAVRSGNVNVAHAIDDGTKAITEQGKEWDETNKKAVEYWKNWAKQGQEMDKQTREIFKHMADQIGSDVGNAFGKMIVEGKSFTETMKQAFKNMAEQIISDIIRMEVEWMILKAIGFSAGGGIGAFMGGGMHATGGSVVADKPTLAVFGEAGPEVASFTPLGNSSGGADAGGSGTINIGTIVTNVSGVNNPDEIARQVGMKIVQQIRGQGQIPFTRA